MRYNEGDMGTCSPGTLIHSLTEGQFREGEHFARGQRGWGYGEAADFEDITNVCH